MQHLISLRHSLLAFGMIPAMVYAATATSPFGPSVATAGVVCSPYSNSIVVTETTLTSTPAAAFCGYSGQWATSTASANLQSIALSGDAWNGAITGAPSAVDDLLWLVTPPGVSTFPQRRHHSWVSLQVSTTHVDDFDLNWVLMTFDVHGLASDSGAAFHFRIWEEWPRHGYIVDVIGGGLFSGRTDFHEVYSVVGSDVLNYRVEGWVLATSQTPEPGTALLAGAALVIAGCYGRRVRALAVRPAARA